MSSIGGFDTFGGAGALSLLSSAGSSGGIFGALSGGSSTPSPTISALGVSNPLASAGQTIQQIIQNQGIQTQKNNIYKSIADNVNAVATGQMQPSTDWQKLGGYYAGIGTPFVITLDSKGQPAITSQDQMDVSRYSATQRNTLTEALTTLQNLAPEVKANSDYTNLQNQWNDISVNLVDIKNNNMVPTTDWQQQAATIMASNHPISFSLAADGTVTVQDQTTSTFEDQDPAVREGLIKASRIVGDAVSTDTSYNADLAQGITPPQALQDKESQYSQYSWVSDASSYASMGVPYTLGVDPTQIDTSVNYVTKTEKTTFSNGQPPTTTSYTVNQNGVDGFGFPDTTSDASNPQPFAAANRITTSIAGITDASGNPISPIKYTNPVNVVSTAANSLAVTDTVTGNTDKFAFDSTAGSLTVTTTNKAGTQIGSASYTATGLSAVASEPPTTTLVDGSGKSILVGGSGLPVTYTGAVTVKNVDANTMTVTDSATGNVDTYSTQLDASGNPVKDAKGNYQISLTHADSLGRSIGSSQTFAASSPGVNALVSPNSNPITIAADGANTTTAISKTTVLPVDKFAAAIGGNGNKLTSSITDGSGNALATYTDPVSIAKDSTGTITVTNKASGTVDTYSDGGNGTISISHKDSAGDVIAATTTASGSGLNAVVAQTPTLSFTDGSGAAIKDDNGNPLPTYSNPVTFVDTSSGTDKSFKVTDAATGYVDTYSYSSATNSLTMSRVDKNGTQLLTQTASAVTGFAASTTPLSVGVTGSSGAAVLDASGAAPPSYTTPVSIKDTGNGSFSITNSSTGAVDLYAYDSAAQTLSITHNDSAGNTLSTQSFSGVAKLTPPWASMGSGQSGAATTWDVFNKTTLHSTLASASSYSTSYDTSTFDLSNPATPVDTANAYSSTTSFSYANVDVGNPTLMQSALPNLKLNYVTTPKITVTAVTDVPMPTTLEPATPPYDLNSNSMPKWEADAMGFMKAGTPYMLDFDQQGNLVAKQLTGDNVVKFNNPQPGMAGYNPAAQSSSSSGLSGIALMLSTVA